MNRTELYINGAAVDLPPDFNIRINRALLNPAELNAKDAQHSYTIALPMTRTNAAAFQRADVEETRDKFNRLYAAELIVNGVKIFEGVFRMSEISDGFKGNLYVPDRKSIKDIFGELKLTDNRPFEIPFADFAESVNLYNAAAEIEPQAAIFPYVLYGVLPKTPLNRDANTYSARTVWDESVRIGIQDLPPSVNVLTMLRHIFTSQGYTIDGTAFDDDRLARIYQSYQNPEDYVQPWNYGQHAAVHVRGQWSSRYNKRTSAERLERGINQGQGSGGATYGVDFLDATNTRLEVLEDRGGNVLYTEVDDNDGVTWVNGQIRVPTAGFYKVQLNASLRVHDWENWRVTDPATGVQHIGGRTSNVNNWLIDNPFEIRLCRDWGKGADFGLASPKLNGVFYHDNQPQNMIFDGDNIPKYFPRVTANGQLNFVDLAQDRGHLLGFAFGKHEGTTEHREYVNPRDDAGGFAQILAAKPAQSWQAASTIENPTRLAIASTGWWKYGRVGDFDGSGENPNTSIDYSGGPFQYFKVLDSDGNLLNTSVPNDNVILHRFPLERYFTYRLTAPAGHNGTAYLHNGSETAPAQVITFVDGVATFDTNFYPVLDFAPRLTLYLVSLDYDIYDDFNIERVIEETSEDIIGWELTNKYAITLQNAPLNFARRGEFNGVSQDVNWTAQGRAAAVVWLEAGELLTVASVSSQGRYRRDGMHSTYGLVAHEVDFELSVQPFRIDASWLKVNLAGNGTGVMNWYDDSNFQRFNIDLVKFLNIDTRTDEYIDNIVKAFNLKLTQTGDRSFRLDLKQTRKSVSTLSIDLDQVASVRERVNTPLGLPSRYKIGFTVNTDEQGFVESGDDGGGTFDTGAIGGDVVEQKSNFSYNWFKDITQGAATLSLPIISKTDVWQNTMPYPEAMGKRYTDLATRFWYFDGQLDGTFEFNGEALTLAQVSNELDGVNILNYKNQKFTLLDNYFTLLINGASHYTEIEAYITPAQYKALNGAIMAKFNGDLYFIAELNGYDPAGRNKTKIKLIRRA